MKRRPVFCYKSVLEPYDAGHFAGLGAAPPAGSGLRLGIRLDHDRGRAVYVSDLAWDFGHSGSQCNAGIESPTPSGSAGFVVANWRWNPRDDFRWTAAAWPRGERTVL